MGPGVRDGDAEFTLFVAASSPRLRRVAFLLCGDMEQAKDLLQTAYAKAYAVWSRVRRDDAEVYVRRILINLHNDHFRRGSWRETGYADVPETGHQVASTGQVDTRRVVVEALRQLRPRERSVVVLRYYVDLTEAQTASVLGVSVGTVKKTASVALARMRAFPELADVGPIDTTGTLTWLGGLVS